MTGACGSGRCWRGEGRRHVHGGRLGRSVRSAKEVAFIALNDGSCLGGIQVVVEPSLPAFEEISRLGYRSSLSVSGTLVESPAAGQRSNWSPVP